MLVRLDEMAVRIMRADGDDRPGHVVHHVDVYAAHPWPILVIIRPNIGGRPLSLSLTWRKVERKARRPQITESQKIKTCLPKLSPSGTEAQKRFSPFYGPPASVICS